MHQSLEQSSQDAETVTASIKFSDKVLKERNGAQVINPRPAQ